MPEDLDLVLDSGASNLRAAVATLRPAAERPTEKVELSPIARGRWADIDGPIETRAERLICKVLATLQNSTGIELNRVRYVSFAGAGNWDKDGILRLSKYPGGKIALRRCLHAAGIPENALILEGNDAEVQAIGTVLAINRVLIRKGALRQPATFLYYAPGTGIAVAIITVIGNMIIIHPSEGGNLPFEAPDTSDFKGVRLLCEEWKGLGLPALASLEAEGVEWRQKTEVRFENWAAAPGLPAIVLAQDRLGDAGESQPRILTPEKAAQLMAEAQPGEIGYVEKETYNRILGLHLRTLAMHPRVDGIILAGRLSQEPRLILTRLLYTSIINAPGDDHRAMLDAMSIAFLHATEDDSLALKGGALRIMNARFGTPNIVCVRGK